MLQTVQSQIQKLLQRKGALSCFFSRYLSHCLFSNLVSVLFVPSFILKYAIFEMIAHVFILLVTKEYSKTHFCFNGRKQIRVINFSTHKFPERLSSISLSFNGFTATSLKHAISSGGLLYRNLTV